MSGNRIALDFYAIVTLIVRYYSKMQNHASEGAGLFIRYFEKRALYMVDFIAKCDTILTISVLSNIVRV